VLVSQNQEDGDVYFHLKGRTRAGGNTRELGQGFVNLRELLREERDLLLKEIPLRGRGGDAGTLVVSLLGYEVLRAAAPPLSSWERASHHRDLEFAAVDDIQATAV